MIKIYGKKVCPYCDQVKNALDNMGTSYEYIDIEEDSKAMDFFIQEGFRSVPQLFYEGKHYGGSEGLVDLINDMME